ncbi:TPA: hypothetical protein ACH3X2_011743 [Trebouxia sp. C0005]
MAVKTGEARDLESLNKPDDSAHNAYNATTLKDADNLDEDGHIKRTGNWITASAHIVTAVIGSGVLSLAWAIAQMGWVAGPVILFLFAAVTWYMSLLLADAYRNPRDTGKRNYTYPGAVSAILGGSSGMSGYVWFCGIIQYLNLVGTGIGYTVTAGLSMTAVRRSNCFHANQAQLNANGGESAGDSLCHVSNNPFMLIFGAFQILLSQIPDFDRLWFLSIVAAVMSFSYSSIGLGLAIGKTTESGHSTGFAAGATATTADKTWNVLNGLGSMAFAYSFSFVLVEIQDTIKKPKTGSEAGQMKKATTLAIFITTGFYMAVGTIGYGAFGDDAPTNLLTGFGFFNPYWLIDIANVFIMVHLVGAYQVFTQPWYAFVETTVYRYCPKNFFTHKEFVIRIPGIGALRLTLFRLIWRTLYVCFTTVIAMLVPFFNDVVGLLGALGFWPLTVFLPIQMHLKQAGVPRFGLKWCVLQCVSFICLLVSLGAAVGSIAQIVLDTEDYTPFVTNY